MEKYTLRINSNVFIWIKGRKGMVYNSLNFKFFRFDVSDKIKEICRELDRPENLYTVVLMKTEVDSLSFKTWVENLISIDAANLELYQKDYLPSLKPILKIHNDREKVIKNRCYLDVVNSLKEINIHLNGMNLSLEEKDFYKQFLYPTQMLDKELDYYSLISFLKFIPQKEGVSLNFVGNYCAYSKFKELYNFLNSIKNPVTFYFRLDDIYFGKDKLKDVIARFNVHIICKLNKASVSKIKVLSKRITNISCSFLVSSKKEIEMLEMLELDNIRFKIVPVFTTNNENFLSENIYLEEKDCLNFRVDKRHIFMNKTMNGLFFGNIEILPDGSVWDNLNFEKIGLLHDDFADLMLAMYKEKGAWFYKREQYPCNKCLYQWLCPPPSNYELVMNKPNLCHIVVD